MKVAIVYHSETGATAKLATLVAEGAKSVPGVAVTIRRVEDADVEEMCAADGIIFGSPDRFGSMSATMKAFVEQLGRKDIFFAGRLENKVGAVFCSSGSLHCGKELTLLSLMMPLLHLGMYVVGVPEKDSIDAGSCYGAAFTSGKRAMAEPTSRDAEVARLLGRRVAELVVRLAEVSR